MTILGERQFNRICGERLSHKPEGLARLLRHWAQNTRSVTHSIAANNVPHWQGFTKVFLDPTWNLFTQSIICKWQVILTWWKTETKTKKSVNWAKLHNRWKQMGTSRTFLLPSIVEEPATDQPTLRPGESTSSGCSFKCWLSGTLSILTSKPTQPLTTPWVSRQPDHNEGNWAQYRGCPHIPSGVTSKWRWPSSAPTR